MLEPWPTGEFGCVLADPPWKFETWGAQDENTRGPERHYETMEDEAICAMPVKGLAARDCVLLMWVTWPKLEASFTVIKAWGFTYKTLGFIWVKGDSLPLFPDDKAAQTGTGYWSRANTEPCLLATRGHPKRLNKDVSQVFFEKRRQHSRKPDDIYTRTERLVAGPHCELFARTRHEGWTSWGNQVGKFTKSGED